MKDVDRQMSVCANRSLVKGEEGKGEPGTLGLASGVYIVPRGRRSRKASQGGHVRAEY